MADQKQTIWMILWAQKKLRMYILLNAVVVVGLLLEFCFFEYSVFKIMRYLILTEGLFIIAWIDQKKKIIPNKILFFLTIGRMILFLMEWIYYPQFGLSILISSTMGAVIGGGAFLLCFFISRGGIGAGDVKLFAVIGLYLGNGVIMPNIILIVFLSAIYSIVLLVRKKTNLKEEIPFGPFILVGTLLTMGLGM